MNPDRETYSTAALMTERFPVLNNKCSFLLNTVQVRMKRLHLAKNNSDGMSADERRKSMFYSHPYGETHQCPCPVLKNSVYRHHQ